LRIVSSHRGLAPEQFEEYTRRQYRSRKPIVNPFGDDDEPKKFWSLDVFTRVQIMHQLSVWVFLHPDRVRDKMKKAGEKEQLAWVCSSCAAPPRLPLTGPSENGAVWVRPRGQHVLHP
jgi:hypothetical protein